MTKAISVPIPQNMIDEAAGGEVSRLTKKVARLEKQVAELREREDRAKEAVKAFDEVRSYMAEKFDLFEDYGF